MSYECEFHKIDGKIYVDYGYHRDVELQLQEAEKRIDELEWKDYTNYPSLPKGTEEDTMFLVEFSDNSFDLIYGNDPAWDTWGFIVKYKLAEA